MGSTASTTRRRGLDVLPYLDWPARGAARALSRSLPARARHRPLLARARRVPRARAPRVRARQPLRPRDVARALLRALAAARLWRPPPSALPRPTTATSPAPRCSTATPGNAAAAARPERRLPRARERAGKPAARGDDDAPESERGARRAAAHQRLQMIKASGAARTTREAMRELMSARGVGAAAAASPFADSAVAERCASPDDDKENFSRGGPSPRLRRPRPTTRSHRAAPRRRRRRRARDGGRAGRRRAPSRRRALRRGAGLR